MENWLKRNEEAQALINIINTKINLLKKGGVEVQNFEISNAELVKSNEELKLKIESAKYKLLQIEICNGKKQIPIPEFKKLNDKDLVTPCSKLKTEDPKLEKTTLEVKEEIKTKDKLQEKKETKPKIEERKETKTKGDKKSESTDAEIIDASKLDMRIGRIIEVSRHADADSLFVEKVDVGEDKPRQIISGLVKYCSEADLQGRLAVFLLNLKPAKMRGVLSEGMIMCASAPEQGKVEPLNVPVGVKPGDRVTVEGYEGVPDDVLNPKKKVFELIKPDLKVNGDGVATYKGARWQVNGQVGVIVAKSLVDVQIS